MDAQLERHYDEYERMADYAWMMRAAYHSERLKHSQLFKRPVGEDEAKSRMEGVKERMEKRIKQLERFEEFRGKFKRKEEMDG